MPWIHCIPLQLTSYDIVTRQIDIKDIPTFIHRQLARFIHENTMVPAPVPTCAESAMRATFHDNALQAGATVSAEMKGILLTVPEKVAFLRFAYCIFWYRRPEYLIDFLDPVLLNPSIWLVYFVSYMYSRVLVSRSLYPVFNETL